MGIRKGRCLWSSSPHAGMIYADGIMNVDGGYGSDSGYDDHDGDGGSEMGGDRGLMTKLKSFVKN